MNLSTKYRQEMTLHSPDRYSEDKDVAKGSCTVKGKKTAFLLLSAGHINTCYERENSSDWQEFMVQFPGQRNLIAIQI